MHIPRPDWARAFTERLDGDEAVAAYRRIQARWDEIGRQLHERIEAFFNDPERAFRRPEEGFPLRERLTGEYYIGDVSCHRTEFHDRPACYGSVMFRCLEKPWLAGQIDRDYLGLEAGIYLWLDTGEIELDEGFTTSSI